MIASPVKTIPMIGKISARYPPIINFRIRIRFKIWVRVKVRVSVKNMVRVGKVFTVMAFFYLLIQ